MGIDENVNWHGSKTMTRFEAKVKGRIGPGEGDTKSMRVLNRVVHWAPEGIEYEADQMHAEIIAKELGLTMDNNKCGDPKKP